MRWSTSARLTAVLTTSTTTSSGPGSGSSISETDRTSGPPCSVSTTARTGPPLGFVGSSPVQTGPFLIRPVQPEEADELGALTLAAYAALPGHVEEPDYDAELLDVAARAKVAEVLVAVDEDGSVLGGVTFVPDGGNPLAEHAVADASTISMLAVAGPAQGRGVGEALARACIERAREVGSRHVVLHSTPWMHGAHRLYGRLGFVRRPDLDWTPVP